MGMTSLPFEKDVVIGKIIREDVIFFIYKTDESMTELCAVLVRKLNDAGEIEIGESYNFHIPESDNFYVWSDEDNWEKSNDIVFAYSPKVVQVEGDSTQVDQALLMKYDGIKITDTLTVNFDRKGELNLQIMWMFKDGPRDIQPDNSGSGISDEMVENAKRQMEKPTPVYGKKGGLKGVKLPDGRFQRIDTPYEGKTH